MRLFEGDTKTDIFNSNIRLLTHNSRIDVLLIDDKGYSIAPWLMMHYIEPLNAPHERSYNNSRSMEIAFAS